jgi:phosphoglycolate phosphatase|tara:strand:+ start:1280 stop:1948 length:669 start_codon:yes stop_codon:yes gene_type:complete
MKIFDPKLIMIDVDGTLVDSVPDLAFCVDQMMIELGLQLCGEERVRNWVGNGIPKLIERALIDKLDKESISKVYEVAYPIFLKLYSDNSAIRSRLYDGVKEGLDYLKSKGYLLGCVTNKAEQFTNPLLKKMGIYNDFRLIISGDTLDKKKPDPLPLLHGANFFNMQPNECLMLGDSVSDVRAARAAGFDIICMSYGYNHGNNIEDENPDLVIDSMDQLKEHL